MNIYDELRSGASAEDLVAQFTAQLNEAEARIKQEDEEAEAAKIAKVEAKRNDMIDAIESIVTVVERHYPDLLDGETIDTEAIESMADVMIMMLDMHSVMPVKPVWPAKEKAKAKTATSEDIFADFFKSFGL